MQSLTQDLLSDDGRGALLLNDADLEVHPKMMKHETSET